MPKNANSGDGRRLLQNSINTLVANIRFAGQEEPIGTIVITSSVPNEGKTTIAVNLAATLARNGNRTIILECDCHNRSVSGTLGVQARTGLYSVLLGSLGEADASVATNIPNLRFLDCEPSIPNPANVFASGQFKALLRELRHRYDYVVIDTPPLSAYVDGAVVGAAADATLLVARWDYVNREDVKSSMNQLDKAGAKVIGAVLNQVEEEHDYYYYGYYGKEDGKRGRRSRSGDKAVPKVVVRRD